MTDEELATETKMRGLTADMTRPEGLVMLNLMLERSTTDEISDAIEMTKLSHEVKTIARKLSNF